MQESLSQGHFSTSAHLQLMRGLCEGVMSYVMDAGAAVEEEAAMQDQGGSSEPSGVMLFESKLNHLLHHGMR